MVVDIKKALARNDRTAGIWITSHTAIYDLKTKSTRLVFEEAFDGPNPMRFGLWLREPPV